MTASFYSNEQAALTRNVEADEASTDGEVDETVFEIDRCVEWIKENDLHRVALQFPDRLLSAAPSVSTLIRTRLGEEVFILGDTSFGECCVDEVAAEHVNADGIIHFGHSCLSQTKALPVLLVFTRLPLCLTSFSESISSSCSPEANLLLLYDVEYHHCLDTFRPAGDRTGRVVTARPRTTGRGDAAVGVYKFGRQFATIADLSELAEFSVVYVGRGGQVLLNFVLSLPCRTFLVYSADRGRRRAGAGGPAGREVADEALLPGREDQGCRQDRALGRDPRGRQS